MIKHDSLWMAIDRLAEQKGVSVSALAKRAGLDPTSFSPSKRTLHGRPRWPSTESLVQLFRAVGIDFHEFLALAEKGKRRKSKIPSLMGGSMAVISFNDPALRALVVEKKHQPCLYPVRTVLILHTEAKPRRGDPVVVQQGSGRIRIGLLHNESQKALDLAGTPNKTGKKPAVERINRDDVVRCLPIVWASQGSFRA